MTETKVRGKQLRFLSENTGNHVLDTYLEAAEIGGRSLADLLGDLFDPSDGEFRSELFEFRESPSTPGLLQVRVGDFVDPNAGWEDVTSTDFQAFVTASEAAQLAAEDAQAAAEAARDLALSYRDSAQSHRDDAQTYASNASGSASTALGHANVASSSASAALGSETNAAASALAAASSYDDFDDRYLGPKASDPALDNDGDPLTAGALYFNTTMPEMRVYTGSSWISMSNVATAAITGGGIDGVTITNSTYDGHTIWHSGNDGASSGLDADTLDGEHASDFLSAYGPTVTGGYFEIEPYSGSYDDGSHLQTYYDGNNREWNIRARNASGTFPVHLRIDGGVRALGASTFDTIAVSGGATLGGDILLYRDDGSTVGARWDASTGRFGIGVSGAPQFGLEVQQNQNAGLGITRPDKSRYVYMGDTGSTDDGGLLLYDGDGNAKVFFRGQGDSYINGGNLAIGKTSPTERLDVDGNIVVSGMATLGAVNINGGTVDGTAIGESAPSSGTFSDLNVEGANIRLDLAGGDVRIQNTSGADILQLIDAGAASAALANPYIEFLWSTVLGGSISRLGYVGFGSVNNSDLYLVSDNGNVRIDPGSGSIVLVYGGLEVDNNPVWHEGNQPISVAENPHTLVRRDGEGDISGRYLQGTHVWMTHTQTTRNSDTIFYSSTDSFVRKNTKEGFLASLGLDTVPFTKSYESAEQTITSGGSLTLAHGLGAVPKLVLASIKCTSADSGYSVGDEVFVNPGVSSLWEGPARGLAIQFDSTNIVVRIGSDTYPIDIINWTTGGYGSIIASKWKIIIRAFA